MATHSVQVVYQVFLTRRKQICQSNRDRK